MDYVEALERTVIFTQIIEDPVRFKWEAIEQAAGKWNEIPDDLKERIEALSDHYRAPEMTQEEIAQALWNLEEMANEAQIEGDYFG